MDNTVEEMVSYARDEIALRREQGCDTWEWERLIALFEQAPGPNPMKRARSLVRSIQSLAPDEEFPYEEPDALESIRALRPEGPRTIATGLSEQRLQDATSGAWLGLIAGCMLGKPVRHWHRVKIDGLMRVCELDALDDYIPPTPDGRGFDFRPDVQGMLRKQITYAARDAALDSSVLALRMLENFGTGFDTTDVADRWLHELPFGRLDGAQKAAYRNLVNSVNPPETARQMNPYREQVGALARGCAWGWALPARPEQAAALAWRDARISHERNGVYAAMWSAAATSAAFAAHSARQAVQVGLSEIPAECRLAELVRQLDEAHEGGQAAPDTVEEVMKQYRSHSALHVLSNAAAAVIGLLWGDGDFSRTIGLTVRAGQDTVGNAAVAGGVCGALVGEGAIAEHWTEPLNDSMETALTGPSPLSISELLERTRHVQDRLATEGQAGK